MSQSLYIRGLEIAKPRRASNIFMLYVLLLIFIAIELKFTVFNHRTKTVIDYSRYDLANFDYSL